MNNQSNEDKIKELEHEVAKLRGYLRTDTLTQTLNRKGLNDQLASVFDEIIYTRKHSGKRRKMEIEDLSVVFIDLDDFKQINDTYGHDAGDTVLQAVGAFLLRSVRGIDHVGRYGGEEFVLVLVGATEDEAYRKSVEIKERLNQISLGKDIPVDIRASFGVASLGSTSADDLHTLIDSADKAMYEAKHKRGKNTVVRYSELS